VLNIIPIIDPLGPYCEYDVCETINATPIGGVITGNNVLLGEYCPDNGFIGVDNITYVYQQSGCVFDTTIITQIHQRPTVIPVIDGVINDNYEYHEICEGDSIQDMYEAQSLFFGFNEWYVFGDTLQGPTINLTWNQEGIFTFDVVRWSNGCVSLPETFTVSISLCPEELIYIANTFTPDGDEVNQVWQPIFTQGYDPYDVEITVLNRWGQTVWVSKDVTIGWDGSYNGKMCQEGVYTWIIEYGVPENDKRIIRHGHLTLIR
jgi:gliding motility-associated-like protein